MTYEAAKQSCYTVDLMVRQTLRGFIVEIMEIAVLCSESERRGTPSEPASAIAIAIHTPLGDNVKRSAPPFIRPFKEDSLKHVHPNHSRGGSNYLYYSAALAQEI